VITKRKEIILSCICTGLIFLEDLAKNSAFLQVRKDKLSSRKRILSGQI